MEIESFSKMVSILEETGVLKEEGLEHKHNQMPAFYEADGVLLSASFFSTIELENHKYLFAFSQPFRYYHIVEYTREDSLSDYQGIVHLNKGPFKRKGYIVSLTKFLEELNKEDKYKTLVKKIIFNLSDFECCRSSSADTFNLA